MYVLVRVNDEGFTTNVQRIDRSSQERAITDADNKVRNWLATQGYFDDVETNGPDMMSAGSVATWRLDDGSHFSLWAC